MNTQDVLTIALALLFAAYVFVSVRRMVRDYNTLTAMREHSLNPITAYSDRRDLVRRVKDKYPEIFGENK